MTATRLEPITLPDNNASVLGTALNKTYEVVDCGKASVNEILDGATANDPDTALEDKVALVVCTSDLEGQIAAVKQAGAVGMILINTSDANATLATSQLDKDLPTFGAIASSKYLAFQEALKAGKVNVSFATAKGSQDNGRTYADNGPSGFTSWGVADSMKLKLDIMAPGGNILSAGAASNTALSVKSGTSTMATPNMVGAFLLIQQYVDAHLAAFGVEKGTQAYTNVVNWLAASNAVVYQPFKANSTTERQNLYFSPRRQGAGMVNVDNVIHSMVALHDDITGNEETGERPRTKVDVGEVTADTFAFDFVLENYSASEYVVIPVCDY